MQYLKTWRPYLGAAQSQGVHGQCIFKVFWDTSASECQTIAVAHYLVTYEGECDVVTLPSSP